MDGAMADNQQGKRTAYLADKRLEIPAISRWYFLPVLLQANSLSRTPRKRRISP